MSKQLPLLKMGRPKLPKSEKRPVPHRVRDEIPKGKPVHIVWHLNPHVPPCRNAKIIHIFKLAVLKARMAGLRIIHFSLMNNHLHLMVETDNKEKLARELQSFATSFTRRLKYFHNLKSTPIFKERYYCRILKTVQEVKNTLCYVLKNGKKGRLTHFHADPYSSAAMLTDYWAKIFGIPFDFPNTKLAKAREFLRDLITPPETWIMNKVFLPN